MSQMNLRKNLAAKALLAVITLLMFTEPAWAVLGVWRRAAVTTAVVVGSTEAAAASKQNAAASQEAAAAASAQQAAAASAASAASAQQAASAAAQATEKSPQQKLKELQSLYEQKLISQADYQAAKTKILNGL